MLAVLVLAVSVVLVLPPLFVVFGVVVGRLVSGVLPRVRLVLVLGAVMCASVLLVVSVLLVGVCRGLRANGVVAMSRYSWSVAVLVALACVWSVVALLLLVVLSAVWRLLSGLVSALLVQVVLLLSCVCGVRCACGVGGVTVVPVGVYVIAVACAATGCGVGWRWCCCWCGWCWRGCCVLLPVLMSMLLVLGLVHVCALGLLVVQYLPPLLLLLVLL